MREQTIKSKVYPELRTTKCYFGEARACVSDGNTRRLLDGMFAISALDSVKFGKEVHLQIFSKNPFVEELSSGSGAYRRVEFYFCVADLEKLIEALKIVNELEEQNGNSTD